MANGEQILKQYNFIRDHYQNFLTRWDLQAPYLSPSRVGILSDRTPGQDQMAGVYDSTTMGAADMLAKYIASTTFGPGQRWGKLKAKKFGRQDRNDSDDWAEEATNLILGAFGDSNFYREAPEALTDWVAFGTGSVLCEERKDYRSDYEQRRKGFRGLRFQTSKTGRFFNGCNAEGSMDKQFREDKLSARASADKFGKENLPINIQQLVDGERQEKLFTFIHAIYPRSKSDRSYGKGAKGYDFASCWVEKDSKKLVSESGYKNYPVLNPRWEITPGEIPGRGPGDRAFPDTRTLSKAKQLDLEALALDIRKPVLQSSDSVVSTKGNKSGTIAFQPAGLTIVKTKQGQNVRDVLNTLDLNPNYKMSQIKEEELRRSIEELFFVNILKALLKVEKSEMTAFEFAQKLEIMYRILGGVYGGYEYEFLARAWDIAFSIMWDAGALPPLPPEMLDSGIAPSVVFSSPLALAQTSQEADGILKAFSSIPTIALNDPQRAIELKDNLDDDIAVRMIFEKYGVPEIVIKSEEERDKIRAGRTKARADANQMANIEGASEAAKNVAPLISALGKTQGAAGNA